MMDKNERKEMKVLRKKPNKTEKETERHRELLEQFLEETLYMGGTEDDET